jgi:hypothetical protein
MSSGNSGQFSFPVDFSNPIAQIGMQQATSFINRINVPTVSTKWLNSLRYYFAVNNSYVLNKLKIIACPFLHKSWSRRISRQAEGIDTYEPPNQDINAPDLYIPSMAFITYILLVGTLMGTNYNFTPEVLGMTASTGLITMLVEVLMFKAGLYLLNFPSIAIYEIIAYCGYKFVGVTANMISGMVLGSLAFHVTWFVNSLFMAVFMVKTLRLVIPKPVESRAVNTRNYFLFFLAILQFVISYFLCFMDFQMNKIPGTTINTNTGATLNEGGLAGGQSRYD